MIVKTLNLFVILGHLYFMLLLIWKAVSVQKEKRKTRGFILPYLPQRISTRKYLTRYLREKKKITFLLNHDCKNNDKNWQKERVQPKKWCSSHKLFYLLFSVTQSFLLEFPWSPDNITVNNKKNKYKSLSAYLR